METVLQDIRDERAYQNGKTFGGVAASEFDKGNTQADWIAYIVRYASGVHPRLETRKDKNDFRAAMVKVAALAVAAVENHDKGFAQN